MKSMMDDVRRIAGLPAGLQAHSAAVCRAPLFSTLLAPSAGGLLLAYGVRRRGVLGMLGCAAGAVLMYSVLVLIVGRGRAPAAADDEWAPAGPAAEPLEETREPVTDLPESEPLDETADAYRVTESSQDSFPASDAPSWTPGRA